MAADCYSDCMANCERGAPGNKAYCVDNCEDYCEQTDREDGLSGSVNSNKGYVGLASPLKLGATVEYGADRPPNGDILPKDWVDEAASARDK